MAAEEITNLIVVRPARAGRPGAERGTRREPSVLPAGAESPRVGEDGTGIEERVAATGSIDGELRAGEDDGRGCGAQRGEHVCHRWCAALVLDLIGGYAEDDARRVARVARQVGVSGCLGEVLAEATRFTACLTAEARAAGARLRAGQIRTGVLARLAATVPPHQELAVSNALDALFEGRFPAAAEAFGEGPAGDLVALHALTAFTALLGTHVSAPGTFASAIRTALVSVRTSAAHSPEAGCA